ncbi:SLAP domain-containing protein, partial [Lactobacillus acetotolerans]|uniref:SLAP domain-containing protein n=1 Tax=Lactobacillus acetotolerans TaxID=1600 RepID=UPI002FD90596
MKINSGTGWIASYPTSAANKNWYNAYHAWQWGSQYHFWGTTASGNFDVSQLYDNFYTGGQNPVKTNKNIVAIKYWPGYGVDSVHADGSHFKNSNVKFKSGTQWRSSGIRLINNQAHYLVGKNEYIPQKYTDQQYIATVNYIPGYGVDTIRANGEHVSGSRLKMKDDTEWKADYIKVLGGRLYYQVGQNEYLDAAYTVGSGKVYN